MVFVRFGTKLHRQIVGIPMDANCASNVAKFFFFFFFFFFVIFCFFVFFSSKTDNKCDDFDFALLRRCCSKARIFPIWFRCWRPGFRYYNTQIYITYSDSPMLESQQKGKVMLLAYYYGGIIQFCLLHPKTPNLIPCSKRWKVHLVTFPFGCIFCVRMTRTQRWLEIMI